MAKDDYYTIVGKILAFLYLKLKKKSDKGVEYLSPNTKDFPIDEEYFEYVLEHMQKQGLIDGVILVKACGGEVINLTITERIRITPAGIDFLIENNKIRRALKNMPQMGWLAEMFKS